MVKRSRDPGVSFGLVSSPDPTLSPGGARGVGTRLALAGGGLGTGSVGTWTEAEIGCVESMHKLNGVPSVEF